MDGNILNFQVGCSVHLRTLKWDILAVTTGAEYIFKIDDYAVADAINVIEEQSRIEVSFHLVLRSANRVENPLQTKELEEIADGGKNLFNSYVDLLLIRYPCTQNKQPNSGDNTFLAPFLKKNKKKPCFKSKFKPDPSCLDKLFEII